MIGKKLITLFLLFSSLGCCAQFIDASGNLAVNNINEGTLFGNGISFYDFDMDGWDDLTIANGAGNPLFFKNNFADFQLIPIGIANSNAKQILMMLWADYDNDADSDLLITKDHAAIELWQNDGSMNFTNVSASAGLEQADYFYWGAAYCDVDHDGWLDLFITKYYIPNLYPGPEFRSLFYHNNGDGTFTESAMAVGFDLPPRPAFQPVFFDFDGDHWEDLYLVIDRISYPNELFRNNGDGTFTNVTAGSGANIYVNAMSGTIGDFDHDDDQDVYVANSQEGNFLLRNNNNGTFTDVAEMMGVAVYQVCWGSLFLDYDNDTWEDLFVSVTSPFLDPVGNQYYHNNNGTSFNQVNEFLGLDDDPSETYIMAMGDFNNDGYSDFALNNDAPYPTKLYQNIGGGNKYLAYTLQGILSNRDGVGTLAECYCAEKKYIRQVKCGENYTSQNSSRNIFGLGTNTVVDSLILTWNSGIVDKYYNIATNQTIHFVEGSSLAVPFDIIFNGDSILCPGESVELDAGDFAEYLWNTGDTTRYITISTPGDFSVEVVNSLGFDITSNNLNFTAESPVEIASLITNVSCFDGMDGSIELIATGAELVSIWWNNGMDSTFVSDLMAGSYSCEIVYGSGCTMSGIFELIQPDSLSIVTKSTDVLCFGENTGSVVVAITGGTPGYTINWMGNNPDSIATGTYTVLVNDSHGCPASAEYFIGEPEELYGEVDVSSQYENGELGSAVLTISGGTTPYEIIWSSGSLDELSVEELEAGDYSVVIEDINGCEVLVGFTIDFVEGIVCGGKNSPGLFPNPSSGYFALQGVAEGSFEIQIFSQDGRKICMKRTSVKNEIIQLPDLVPGLYHVVISSDNNNYRLPLIISEP